MSWFRPTITVHNSRVQAGCYVFVQLKVVPWTMGTTHYESWRNYGERWDSIGFHKLTRKRQVLLDDERMRLLEESDYVPT